MQFTQRLLAFLALVLFALVSFAQEETPVEITITGKQPGPPKWRVINGNNTLYIFAWLSPIPKNMEWESFRVAQVISEAQEYITMPRADVSVSPAVMLNPINIVRGMGLSKKLTRNEDKQKLEEVIPPELYVRFLALKEKYFPGNKKIEKLRPIVAGGRMTDIIQKEAGLVSASDVRKKIRRLIKKNKDISITEIRYETRIEGKYRDIADRLKNLVGNLSRELELSCFEQRLSQMEEDLDEMTYRANTWAQGYIEEFKYIPLPGDEGDDCTNLAMSSSEKDLIHKIQSTLDTQWLTAAEMALSENRTTFAVLDFSELLLEDGLVATLAAKGYEVIEP